MPKDETTHLSDEEYITTIKQTGLIAQLVRDMPLKAAATTAQRALDIGALFDPSAWIRGNQNCEDALALLRPLIKFQEAAAELEKKVAARR